MGPYQAHRTIYGNVIDCEADCGMLMTRGVTFTEIVSYEDGSEAPVEIVVMLCANCEPEWLANAAS